MTDFERAIEELQHGNYSEGMVILQRLLKDDPDNANMLYNLGVCYSEMGLIKKSIEALERCIGIEPYFANALVALGFSYYQQGLYEKAMVVLQKALEIEPDNFYALKNLGALYNKTGAPDLAISTFKKAESQMPGTPDVDYGLGQAYELKKQYDGAIELYKKVKASGAPDVFTNGATKGLNRIAMSQAREAGGDLRSDVVAYCLEAIELFSGVSEEKVKEIAFEIAMLGTTGLSINDPEKEYTLDSMDGSFIGMQLLCYMFAGFKIIDSSLPPVADLDNEYRQALKIYRSRLDEH